MKAFQLLNLLTRLTEDELQCEVLLDLRFVFAGELDGVQVAEHPAKGKVIRLRELQAPHFDNIIREEGGE